MRPTDPARLASIWDHEHIPLIYVAMLFKRAQTQWRAIHYHESALAAQAAEQINRMKAMAKSA